MSVLVKGMEMPTRCFSCPMCDVENAEVNCVFSHGFYIEYRDVDPQIAMQARPDWCPLIEIPPHGRLIDADKLIAKQEEDAEIFMGSTNYGDKVRYDEAMNAVANIVNAPTVIPADKDGET